VRDGTPHALIVDDDRGFRLGLAEVVSREGFSVASAGSLEEARAEIERQAPDVILVDLQLPDGNGLELVQEPTGAGGPAVVPITGHASVETAVLALRRGRPTTSPSRWTSDA
jgi:DNA-binding NtrC family response regulator